MRDIVYSSTRGGDTDSLQLFINIDDEDRMPRRSIRSSNAWSEQDDATLKDARRRGYSWEYCSRLFDDKTDNACRKHWERLVEKERVNEWDSDIKLGELATAYFELREQMWSQLAERFHERWETIEAKCMEKGLSTLRAASRRTPSMGSGGRSAHNESPDSGIGMAEHDYHPARLWGAAQQHHAYPPMPAAADHTHLQVPPAYHHAPQHGGYYAIPPPHPGQHQYRTQLVEPRPNNARAPTFAMLLSQPNHQHAQAAWGAHERGH